jgi:kynurenine 3-monooxygenase
MDGPLTIVGGGLVGSLLASLLARRGFSIDLYERRPDLRRETVGAGRSINLAVSTRGLRALADAGLERDVLAHAIPMRGRMVHAASGEQMLLRYGKDDSECINSISRLLLNQLLLDHAEKSGRARLHFAQRATRLDLDRGEVTFHDGGGEHTVEAPIIFATDGAGSVVRSEMVRADACTVTETPLDYGYKELTIPAMPGGGFRFDQNALHIWPRGNYMLIALPNLDGSFTCTLFLPFTGPLSFASLAGAAEVREFFAAKFPDAVAHMPDLVDTFFANPTGHMVTVKCTPWHRGGKTLLVGDAAHAIVPFFGQGMNCGFEDCSVLAAAIDRRRDGDWATLFSELSASRKIDTDAIADMAVENFVEMRDKVADARFQLEKKVETVLQARFPAYVTRYRLVTFSLAPYRFAAEIGRIQNGILEELCGGISDAGDVDLLRAERLIEERLVPRMEKTWISA